MVIELIRNMYERITVPSRTRPCIRWYMQQGWANRFSNKFLELFTSHIRSVVFLFFFFSLSLLSISFIIGYFAEDQNLCKRNPKVCPVLDLYSKLIELLVCQYEENKHFIITLVHDSSVFVK